MLRQAYNLGATAHEENMEVESDGWQGVVELNVEVESGGFSYNGDVTVEEDAIKDLVSFADHKMSDEHIEEILKS